jgi:hypothetical protein
MDKAAPWHTQVVRRDKDAAAAALQHLSDRVTAKHLLRQSMLRLCRDEDAAAAALQGLTGRFYNGRPILVEFSPVTDFREATCRQYEENTCTRGGYCNFMHLRPISK